jgi:hypothetical protein
MKTQELILKCIIIIQVILIACIIFKRYIDSVNNYNRVNNDYRTNNGMVERFVVGTENSNNVFIYWVGNEYKLIKILRKLMYYHSNNDNNYKIHLLNDKNITDYLKNIPEVFHKLQPAHQADYVRVNVIYKYGGIWLDSDTIVMDSLGDLFDILNKGNGFFIKEGNDICNGVFGSNRETELMHLWKTEVDRILEVNKDNKDNIGWTVLGGMTLTNIRDNNPKVYSNYKIFDGYTDMYPVIWSDAVKEYIEKPYDNYKNIERDFQPLVILVNSVYKEVEEKSIEDIVNAELPLNYFINKSLQNADKTKKELLDDLL